MVASQIKLLFFLQMGGEFRAEKRNKHVQVLAVRQAPSLKKWQEFARSCKQ